MATEEGDGDKELPDEDEGTVDRPEFKGTNVIKDTVLKVEAVNGDVESGDVGTSQAKGSQSQQLEQSQGAGVAICWQRFLHLTSIKVLLVENDDSTRHILSALLRNCNYEVIEVVNGLQAWTILENLDNHIDLVLTEVVMPCLSGTSLLCKIMSHKTRKTIPVIMMSSHDSVGLVFKCLSKGAADFLLKPIRKNELKNLWQHVWRRCHSSSGSGSESGTQTQKSVKSKSSEQSGNNSGSNDEEDNQRNGPPGNGSDDGSGTQSSWTKQAVEVDSSRAVPPCDRVPVHGDSTCAQVNAETAAHMRAHLKPSRQCQVEEPDNAGIDKPSTTGSVRDPELEPENASEVPLKHLSTRGKSALQIDSNASSLKALSNFLPSEHHVVTAVMSCPEIDSRELNRVVDSLEIDNTSTNDSKHHVVELCLKRQRGPGPLGESGITSQDDRNVLRRSELSAFSRYNSGGNHIRTPNGITQGSYLVENSLEIAKTKPVHVIDTHMNEILLNQRSNGVSNNNAAGCSNTNILISKSLPLSDTNGNSDTGLARTGRGGGEATGSGSRSTMDPFKLVREAPLTKFRQKRKERCFLKKVRYQNRKRQAEQRPRVRGQFVRHIEQNNPNSATEG